MRRLDIRGRRDDIAKVKATVSQRGRIEHEELLRLIGHILTDMGVRGSEEETLEAAGRCLDELRDDRRRRKTLEDLTWIAEAALKLRGRMRAD